MFERVVTSLEAALDTSLEEDLSFEDLERTLLRATNELVRRRLQGRLQQLSNSLSEVIRVGRHVYKRHQPGRVKYFSLCGAMYVDRWTYRRVDVRNGPTIVALDKVAGIAKGATPAMAFAIAQGVAKAPIRSVEEDLRAAYRDPPSRAKMDRIGRYLGGLVDDAVDDVEPRLRECETLPAGAKAINLGLDRTTIPMEEAAEVQGPDGKPKLAVRYRMAYVGTFCISDAHCDALVTRRYAAAAHQGPDRILQRMKADLLRALEQNPELHIGLVQDGAPEMWNLMRAMLDSIPGIGRPRRMGRPRHWRETIDRYHLMEKLAAVLELLIPRDDKRRAELLASWDAALDCKSRAIGSIVMWIERQRCKASPRLQEQLHALVGNYFVCTRHFHYASLAGLGLQQGSGVTEGACKSLISMRAKRSGQRWRPVGISAVLAIRSLLDSQRLPHFWPYFASRFVVPCTNAA
jgi:hypothetical protein